MKRDSGDLFQRETKYFRGKLSGGSLIWQARPDPYKNYPSAPAIALEPPQREGGIPLWEAVRSRRSVRDFRDMPLNSAQLSQLLWASQGITSRHMGYELRAVPSAGALYPVETYLAVRRVEGIEQGIYHYGVIRHELRELKRGDFSGDFSQAALDQDFAASASVVFIWTALFERSKWKYGQRAYRYVYLDAGHIAQNVALAAISLGLGSCQVAALYDDEVNTLIGVNGEKESVLYMTAVGHPR